MRASVALLVLMSCIAQLAFAYDPSSVMKAEKIFLHGGTSWVAQSSQYRYYYVDLTVSNDEWPHHVYFNVTTNTPGAQINVIVRRGAWPLGDNCPPESFGGMLSPYVCYQASGNYSYNASAIMTWPPVDRYYIVVHTQSTTPTVFFGSVAADYCPPGTMGFLCEWPFTSLNATTTYRFPVSVAPGAFAFFKFDVPPGPLFNSFLLDGSKITCAASDDAGFLVRQGGPGYWHNLTNPPGAYLTYADAAFNCSSAEGAKAQLMYPIAGPWFFTVYGGLSGIPAGSNATIGVNNNICSPPGNSTGGQCNFNNNGADPPLCDFPAFSTDTCQFNMVGVDPSAVIVAGSNGLNLGTQTFNGLNWGVNFYSMNLAAVGNVYKIKAELQTAGGFSATLVARYGNIPTNYPGLDLSDQYLYVNQTASLGTVTILYAPAQPQLYFGVYSGAQDTTAQSYTITFKIEACWKNCGGHGTCDPTFNTCTCSGGWTGDFCENAPASSGHVVVWLLFGLGIPAVVFLGVTLFCAFRRRDTGYDSINNERVPLRT